MFKKVSVLLVILLSSIFLYGCFSTNGIKVKLGFKNKDFEYIKQGKIKKIIIQNNRDKGFKFIVEDSEAIKDLYDILSSAKEVKTKSSLEPDYVFEMYEKGGNVYRFNYIAGLDRKDDGNMYSDDKIYIVSERIDNDIIKNFWNIRRKPVDFKDVYYDSILKALKEYIKNTNYENIGINITEDKYVAKFIFSTDLYEFKEELKSDFNNVEMMQQKNHYDVVMKIETEGYKSNIYKAAVSFIKEKNEEEKFFIISKYDGELKNWDIEVFKNEKPKGF